VWDKMPTDAKSEIKTLKKEKEVEKEIDEKEVEELKRTTEYKKEFQILKMLCWRTLSKIAHYAQYVVNDLLQRGIFVKMDGKLIDTGDGVQLVITLIPDENIILRAIRNKSARRLIKKARKEYYGEEHGVEKDRDNIAVIYLDEASKNRNEDRGNEGGLNNESHS